MPFKPGIEAPWLCPAQRPVCTCMGEPWYWTPDQKSPAVQEGLGWEGPWTSPGLLEAALTQRGQHDHGHQEQGQEEVQNPHRRVQRQVFLAAAAAGPHLACGGTKGGQCLRPGAEAQLEGQLHVPAVARLIAFLVLEPHSFPLSPPSL